MARAEAELQALFAGLAHDLGEVVLRAAGPDGIIPTERLGEVQRGAEALVDATFLGQSRKPFDDTPSGRRPLSPYAKIVAEGQVRMIDLQLERQARLLDRVMPADIREGLRARWRR
jgi:hypothetical protein